jgi:protein O-mannosyl-transferase
MSKPANKCWTLLVCFLLAVAIVAAYGQVRSHSFIDFDDPLYVTRNPSVQSGLTWQGIKWAFTTNQAYNWHPLTWMSHMLDCELFGLNPAGHHATSVLLHAINSVLLLLVLAAATDCFWASAFVAGLFALHPLHVESVAWASERKDVLSTLFWLLTMAFYVRYARRPRFATYVPVALAMALGLMAKQMLVTLPLALLLMDYWPLQRFPVGDKKHRQQGRFAGASFGDCCLEKIPLLGLSLAGSLVVYLVQDQAALVRASIPLGYRLGNALVAYAEYILKMCYPLGLGILYPHPERHLPLWQALVATCVLMCLSVAVIRLARSRRWLLVGWLWYLGTLIPVIGLIQVGLQAMADRYTYIPLIGPFIVIAWGSAELLSNRKHARAMAVAGSSIVLLVLAALTYRQVGYWQNSITLFEHTVAVTRNNDLLHYNLGQLLADEGKIEPAIEHFRQAVLIKPDQPTIHGKLGVLLMKQGRNNEAIEEFRQTLRYRRDDKDAQKQLSILLSRQKGSQPPANGPN